MKLSTNYWLKKRINTAVWMHYIDANKTAGEEAWG